MINYTKNIHSCNTEEINLLNVNNNPEYVDELNIKIYTTFVASKEIVWFIFLTLKVKQTWKWAIKEEYLSCS